MDILSLCALCILFAAAILSSIHRNLSQYTYSYASQPQSQYYFLCISASVTVLLPINRCK